MYNLKTNIAFIKINKNTKDKDGLHRRPLLRLSSNRVN